MTNQPSSKANKPSAADKPLTRKQKIFVTEIINNPKQSATAAIQKAYNTKSYQAARSMASENLTKPNIMAVLANHDLDAQTVLAEGLKASRNVYRYNGETKGYELVGDEPDHQSRLRAADSILDRLHGKAKQVQEVHSTGVVLTIDLTSALQDS